MIMTTIVVGLVSDSCHECEELRQRLTEAFFSRNIELEFVEVNYDDNPADSIESVSVLGLVEVPSFLIGGVIFTQYYNQSDLETAIENIREE